tara:strand:+ start:66 stop:287 length:222 start_codon:yes stop_codon:yes gene_type:complete
MAKNILTVMTRKQAIMEFENFVLPVVIKQFEMDGVRDLPARREAWNDWTDSLCKDFYISDWQYMNWTQPDICG